MIQFTFYVAILIFIGTVFYALKMVLFPFNGFNEIFDSLKKAKKNETIILADTRKKIFYENLNLLTLISDMEFYLSEKNHSSLDKGRVNSKAVVLIEMPDHHKLGLKHLEKLELLNEAKYMTQVNVLKSLNDYKTTIRV